LLNVFQSVELKNPLFIALDWVIETTPEATLIGAVPEIAASALAEVN
jgi:hypothetical protein